MQPDHGQVHLAQTAGGNKILQLQFAMSVYFFGVLVVVERGLGYLEGTKIVLHGGGVILMV